MKNQAAMGIYKGKYCLKYEDMFWITQEGEYVYKEQGLEWNLRNTMEFIIEFEEVLHIADWEHLLSCYELLHTGSYYDRGEGNVLYPSDEKYEEMLYQVDKLKVADFVSEIDDTLLPF